MTTVPVATLRLFAEECVSLVSAQFGRQLDWSVDSLGELDDVCAALLADGPLTEERMDLWWKVIGAYTGEVIVRAYGGQWGEHESALGAFAVLVNGITGFPFAVTEKVLSGESFKSLASFGRSLPAIWSASGGATGG
ncbi:hypothetical protein [Streptoalloteichus hindustanus]|uniref:Uncharacterized protein n=1 Tax=Streptoalloteichus hindustanus TaxID=2017 RepID=A0A1M5MW76_STRHI|nr:hypothetical protein [Streptoalloteichus hindustanus]SHG81564.1 hypothetical protein SAMN05444320_11477 [Streptoalloteichus hindustanus]